MVEPLNRDQTARITDRDHRAMIWFEAVTEAVNNSAVAGSGTFLIDDGTATGGGAFSFDEGGA